ncbi:polysaccharide biosynthesis/export family protein [Minwuia sp.]|uniref:polysaccharide biosynthesis/export family protein n=1 Tax=Minwuia sp. TaxID=2493630 RepID=UPI003A8E2505
MNRHIAKFASTTLALIALAAVLQACSDRRYGRDVVVIQPAQPAQAAPAPAVAQPATVAAPRRAAIAPPTAVPPAPRAVVTPAPAAPAIVNQPAVVDGTTVVAAPDTAAAVPVQPPRTAATADDDAAPVRRDAEGRRLVAASNTSTPAGTLGGRPVFAVDDVPENVARQLEEYRLGPGDRLQIKVFGQDEISGEFEVSAAGELSYPLIGQITAENLTPGEFNKILTAALEEFFVTPQVTVEVTNYRPFFILGQVGNPGTYKYQPGLNARMAIAVGGGYTRRAKEEPITIFRTDSAGNLIKFDADQDSVILPGDTIEVHRRLF